MAGYWIVRSSAVRDEAALAEYGTLWGGIGPRFGAEIIDTREGEVYPRQLVIRFPSFADAVACYEDPAYQAAIPVALRAFDRELSILEGPD